VYCLHLLVGLQERNPWRGIHYVAKACRLAMLGGDLAPGPLSPGTGATLCCSALSVFPLRQHGRSCNRLLLCLALQTETSLAGCAAQVLLLVAAVAVVVVSVAAQQADEVRCRAPCMVQLASWRCRLHLDALPSSASATVCSLPVRVLCTW